MQIPAGILADSLGARRTVTIGSFVAGAGSFLFGFAPGITTAYMGRFLVGLGVSIIFIPILKICTEWFEPKRFAAMSGLTLLIGNTGALLASAPLALMANKVGWRAAFLIIGMIGLISGFLSFVFVRDRPADVHLPAPEGTGEQSSRATLPDVLRGLKTVMLNPKSWPPFMAFFGIYGTLMSFQGAWGATYLMHNYGINRLEAASAILPIALGMMIGSPAIGHISDRLGSRKMPFFTLSLMYMAVWLFLRFSPGGKPGLGLFPVMFFIMGLSASGFILSWAIGKEANPMRLSGSAMGFTNMGGFLGAALMQPIFGFALDMKWQGQSLAGARVYPLEAYHLAFAICIAMIGLSLLFILAVKEKQKGNTSAF